MLLWSFKLHGLCYYVMNVLPIGGFIDPWWSITGISGFHMAAGDVLLASQFAAKSLY